MVGRGPQRAAGKYYWVELQNLERGKSKVFRTKKQSKQDCLAVCTEARLAVVRGVCAGLASRETLGS